MDYVSINPGLRTVMKQAFTITESGHIFFLTHNLATGDIEWNMFIDDLVLKARIEKILKDYLTNQ